MTDDTPATPPIRGLDRFRISAGLRDLATFIEHNLDLPIPNIVEINLPVIGESDGEEREEVNRIAEILGGVPQTMYGPHHYTVSRDFGPVVYRATCISSDYMRRYNAKMALVDVIDAHGRITAEEWPV